MCTFERKKKISIGLMIHTINVVPDQVHSSFFFILFFSSIRILFTGIFRYSPEQKLSLLYTSIMDKSFLNINFEIRLQTGLKLGIRKRYTGFQHTHENFNGINCRSFLRLSFSLSLFSWSFFSLFLGQP